MKPITPNFKKGSIAYKAHRHYLGHVFDSFIYCIGPTFIRNKEIFYDILDGVKAIMSLILLLIIVCISPIFCWIAGFLNMRASRKKFKEIGGVYAGKLAHLNKE